MDGIFISYRRDDSAGYAGRIYDRLAAHFGSERVFMDVEGIAPGLDFVDAIESAVGSCRVLIAIIGDEWTTAMDAAGRRRLDDPNDFIRLETSSALKRGIRVVPVLVGGAVMPQASELPDDLKALTRRQAVEINHKQWEASTGELIRALESIVEGASTGAAERRNDGSRAQGTSPVAGQSQASAPVGQGGRRWILAAVAAAVVVGGLWAFLGNGRDGGDRARVPTSPPVVVAQKVPEPPVAAVVPPPQPPSARPAEPAPVPPQHAPPQAKPTVSQAESPTPVIQDFRAEEAAGRTRLCYRVSHAESLVLSPRPGELRRLEENCVVLRVSEATTFTLTARNGDQVVRRTLAVVPPAAAAEPPARVPVAAAPTVATGQAPVAAEVLPVTLPQKGERWAYRAAGKWPTSPKRRFDIVVQSVVGGLVTDSLTMLEPSTGEEVRRGRSDRGDFVMWTVIGPEFSPYLGAFANLAQGPSVGGVTTPDLDPQWTQWYSEAKVFGEESVSVPAGTFKAVKVEVWSSRRQTGSPTVATVEPVRVQFLVWYAPVAKRYVRMQRRILSVSGAELEKDLFELVAHRLP